MRMESIRRPQVNGSQSATGLTSVFAALIRKGVAVAIGAFALIAAVVLAGTSSASASESRVAGEGWSCSGAPVDPGFVIVAYDPGGCNGVGAWFHRPATDGIWTCSGSPVVSGYVITDNNRNGCNGIGSWRHRVAQDKIWTCGGSPIVSGYVTTNFDRNGCNGVGSWFHQLAHNGQWTCGGSPIPPGYKTVKFDPYGCNNVGSWLLVTA